MRKSNFWLRMVAVVLCMITLIGCTTQKPGGTEPTATTVATNPSAQTPSTEPSITPSETTTEPSEETTDLPSEPSTEATEPSTEPTEPEPVVTQITMSFVGDCTLGSNQKHSYSNSFHEYYDKYGPDYFLKNVRSIFQQDDITVVNLEGSLTTSTDIQDKQWNHKGDPEYVQILTGSSVEVATLANNHRLDYGVSGFIETMDTLDQAGVDYCYNDKYLVYEVKGIKIGIVSVSVSTDWTRIFDYLEEGREYLMQQGCAALVCCVHWGGQKTPVLNQSQRDFGPQIIDMGYDLVVGNHPHVLQAMQIYKGKFICYSLGNFCYGGSKNPDDKDSGIFQQTFTFVDGVLVPDTNARFIPCYLSGSQSQNDYQPTLVYGDEFKCIIDKVNGYSKEFGFAWNDAGYPLVTDED